MVVYKQCRQFKRVLGGINVLEFKKNNIVPLYTQVADWIRENIYGKIWRSGESIPSEYQMMRILNVSRGTVKKAIETLSTQGLIIKIQGKGTFVADSKISYSLGSSGHGLLSFAESLTNKGVSFETKVLVACFEPADEDVAKKLQINQGNRIFHLERIRSVEGKKAMFIENWINPILCPGIDMVDYEKETLFSTIEKLSQHKIKFTEGRYLAKNIGGRRGALLEVSKDAPVLHVEQLTHLDNDFPVDLGLNWLRSDQYYLNLMLYR